MLSPPSKFLHLRCCINSKLQTTLVVICNTYTLKEVLNLLLLYVLPQCKCYSAFKLLAIYLYGYPLDSLTQKHWVQSYIPGFFPVPGGKKKKKVLKY